MILPLGVLFNIMVFVGIDLAYIQSIAMDFLVIGFNLFTSLLLTLIYIYLYRCHLINIFLIQPYGFV